MFSFGGVLNRDSFLFLLDLEVKKARRYRDYVSLLSLTLGHLKPSPGKDLSVSFKTFAHLVKDDLRETDIVGQAAGNRLLVMLPYANNEVAHKVGERLKKTLQNYGFGRKGFTVEVDQVCFPTHATTANDLLRIAGKHARENRP